MTIEGFQFDGTSGTLTGGVSLTNTGMTPIQSYAMTAIGSFNSAALNGIDVSVYGNIPTYTAISGLKVENNIIQNIAYQGIDIGFASNGTPSGNSTISQNLFKNIGAYNDEGDAVRLYNNFYADVTANQVLNTRMGIENGNFSLPNPGAMGSIASNEIEVRRRGIFYNLTYGTASGLPVTGNTITATSDDLGLGGSVWAGVYLITQQGTVTTSFQGNTIDGSGSNYAIKAGYVVSYTASTADVSISGGTVSNVTYGIWEDSQDPNGFGSIAYDVALTVSDVNISAGTYGIYVHDTSGTYGVAATIENGTTIAIGGTGSAIEVDGALASVSFSGASPASLTSTGGNYITLANGALGGASPTVLDATGVSFNGQTVQRPA